MSIIMIYLAKVCISSGLFWLYFLIALRNKPFHAYNRFYLLFSTAASLLIPLVNVNWFTWESSSSGAAQFVQMWQSADTIPVFTVVARTGINWQSVVLISMACISLIAIAVVLWRISRIYRIKKQYPVTSIEYFYFINTDIPQAPFSFLNNLFWRKDLSMDDANGKMIMQHELTHINQKHSLDKLFMQLLLCLFWMNPFFWITRKELSMVHEFIADEQSVENKDAAAFAAMLLNVQLGKNIYAPAQPFNYSPIKRRLLMLTKTAVTKYSYARRFMAVPLLIVIVLLSAFKVQQKQIEALAHNENKEKQETIVVADSVITPHTEDTTKQQKKNSVTITNAGKTVVITPSTDRVILSGATDSPIYILNGVQIEKLDGIDPSDIDHISVLKNQAAIAIYGEQASNGVIDITTRQYAKEHGTEHGTAYLVKKTENGEIATFVGGADGWGKYLEQNLRRNVTVDNHAPAGKYTVILDFQVAADGAVSDVRVQSNPGYGTGEEAARVMSLSPKWTPASLSGTPVLSRQKQAITFIVEEK